MTTITSIGVLGYESCSEQDTLTPLEIFKGAAMVLSGALDPLALKAPPQTLDVQLVALEPGNVKMQMGTQVVPDSLLADQTFDILYVPGGVGCGAMTTNSKMLDTIRRHYEAGKVVAANCSGVGILFRAGILGDVPVTCVAAIVGRLQELGANVPMPRRMWRGHPDARLWTTTGSYGINGSTVAMVSHYFGRDVAGLTVSTMFDTLGGIGQDAFELTGPEFYTYPEIETQLHAFWEDMLLPKAEA